MATLENKLNSSDLNDSTTFALFSDLHGDVDGGLGYKRFERAVDHLAIEGGIDAIIFGGDYTEQILSEDQIGVYVRATSEIKGLREEAKLDAKKHPLYTIARTIYDKMENYSARTAQLAKFIVEDIGGVLAKGTIDAFGRFAKYAWEKLSVPIMYIMGNHDAPVGLLAQEKFRNQLGTDKITYLQPGSITTFRGHKIAGRGGSWAGPLGNFIDGEPAYVEPYEGTHGNAPPSETALKSYEVLAKNWPGILVSHTPAIKRDDGNSYGDTIAEAYVSHTNPEAILVSGHVHLPTNQMGISWHSYRKNSEDVNSTLNEQEEKDIIHGGVQIQIASIGHGDSARFGTMTVTKEGLKSSDIYAIIQNNDAFETTYIGGVERQGNKFVDKKLSLEKPEGKQLLGSKAVN